MPANLRFLSLIAALVAAGCSSTEPDPVPPVDGGTEAVVVATPVETTPTETTPAETAPAPVAPAEAAAPGRRYELERVGTTAIVQVYADGFEALSLRDKLLAYHLAQAAIAGRDIYLDQRFASGLALRWVLESLYVVKDKLEPAVAKEVDRYCKLFWVHSGIHDNLTTQKTLLNLSWEQFSAACDVAQQRGIDLSMRRLAPLADLREAYAIMTDPKTFRSVTDKSTEDGNDPIAASCNNLYVGVSSQDLANFEEKNGLNSRLKKEDGVLKEEVYRCGDGHAIAPGRYAEPLARVNEYLRQALAYAPEPTAKAIRALMRYNQTGDLADWRRFNIAWVQDKDSAVDFTLGFVEVYLDARGIKGSWEGIVSFRDEQKTKAIAALATEAPWFEARMPWDERYKKPDVKGITARAINIVTETGDSGPITPIGINLPNEADVRQEYGSKSVNLANIVDAYNQTSTQGSLGEFAASPEEAERGKLYSSAMDDLHTNLHEVVGHASGQVAANVGNPAQLLGLYYSTLEEARADLVGLYWIADGKLKEMGLVPNDDAVLAKYEAYARNALLQLRRVPRGGRIEEDHMRNRQMIVHWLLQNDGGVHREDRGGKTFYVVESAEKFRAGCGRLLAEVMRIKAEGDFGAGKKLVETFGTKVDPALLDQVLARMSKLNLASVTGFVQPELHLKKDANGRITDVEVVHCQDLADQMLRWSGRR